MEVKQFKAFAEWGWCNMFQNMEYSMSWKVQAMDRCVLLSNMMTLSVSCTDGDIRVHKDFTTVMVLLSINISESSLQRGSITGCCVNGMSVSLHFLPSTLTYQLLSSSQIH